MKKRFLPFSLLLVIMIIGQSVMADQVGHYVPRVKESSAEAYLYSLRANQHTGMIDPAWLIAASKQAENNARAYDTLVYWKSMGPDNMGGRTTSVLYNNLNTNEAYIGSMGGGVFYTWNMGVSWHQVGGKNLMVSCMIQDENGVIYVGTGDGGKAYAYNSLETYGYENSFIGTGLYKLENKVLTLVDGTDPATDSDWGFINDIALDSNTIIVATNAGVKYLKDGNWIFAKVGEDDLTGVAYGVEVADDHTIVASVGGLLYVGPIDNMVCKSNTKVADLVSNDSIIAIGKSSGLLDIAVAPSDPNIIYVGNIKSNGSHSKFYRSDDNGISWHIVLPTVDNTISQHQIYNGQGLRFHGIVVDPTNSYRIYVTAENLWVLNGYESNPNGFYEALQLTNQSNPLNYPLYYAPYSVHLGINGIAFSPNNPNTAYMVTDGGVYKANKAADGYMEYLICNRGYVTTRCLGVAPSGKNTRVVAGLIDHGPILINGLDGTNNMETGDLLLPSIVAPQFGAFSNTYSAASCFVSLINPDAFILTTVDGGLRRTFNGGVDYDNTNFKTSFSYTGYRLPIAYWEGFDDDNILDEVMFKCKKDQKVGDTVICYSNACDYPFEYKLTQAMHFNTEHPELSDSIFVHDPISTKLFVTELGSKLKKFYTVSYTLDAMHPAEKAEWFNVIGEKDSVASVPTCMVLTPDGDNLFIGTDGNEIVRVTNLRQAIDANTATSDSADYVCTIKKFALPTNGQAVTSISIYPEDANKLVVTLANYGNTCYVLYCDNALSDNLTFTEKQGTGLPAMPVYSSVYTSTYDGASNGHVLIGTDHGVYRTENIADATPVWTLESANMGDVPVMEMKQQIVKRDDFIVTTVIEDVPMTTVYPGTNNQGVIYAATYGRGLFRCETYRQESGAQGVHETPATAESKVSMYPNPARDAAKISFELNSNAAVSYQVFDMSGRMVKTEMLGNFSEGKHEVGVSVNDLAKGAYVLRLNAGNRASSVKFMVF